MSLYIAYGSNLNLRQMERRCPGAKIFGNGEIKDYALVYRGSKTGAYATIIPSKGDHVPVVVWCINDEHEKRLDLYEGFPTFYYKKDLPVCLDRDHNLTLIAMAYVMNNKAKVGKPSEDYLRVCEEGYVDNGLDLTVFNESIERNYAELEEKKTQMRSRYCWPFNIDGFCKKGV